MFISGGKKKDYLPPPEVLRVAYLGLSASSCMWVLVFPSEVLDTVDGRESKKNEAQLVPTGHSSSVVI